MKRKKNKPKVEISLGDMDEETMTSIMSTIMVDTLINLLIRKKVITKKELKTQASMDRKDIQKFIKNNPDVVDEIKEQIVSKREVEERDLSYMG